MSVWVLDAFILSFIIAEGRKMAPQVNLFKPWMIWMKIAGADSPSARLPYSVALLWKIIMLYGSVHYVGIMFLAIVVGDRAFHLKLEAGLFLLAGVPCAYKHFVFALRKDKLHSVIDRLNALLEQVEDVYGTETLAGWQRMCNIVMYFYSTQFTMIVLPVFSFCYYKYYWEGVANATPYEVYIPFERENHIHRVMLYELLSFLGPAASLIMSNIFFGSLTIAVTGILKKIKEQFRQLSPSNEKIILKRTVQWHAEIILIVGETNGLLGTVFVVEYLLAMVYICFSGYMLIKVGSAEDVNLNKNIILCIVCIVMPVFYCLCGHMIFLEYERMSSSIFQNDWISMSPEKRKNLILPALLAKRGLSLHYKNLIKFDMTTYLKIVKQSYSFLTMLKLMENT